jgi:hypothetical protein
VGGVFISGVIGLNASALVTSKTAEGRHNRKTYGSSASVGLNAIVGMAAVNGGARIPQSRALHPSQWNEVTMASAKSVIQKAQKEIKRLEKLKSSGKEDSTYCDQQIEKNRAAIARLS